MGNTTERQRPDVAVSIVAHRTPPAQLAAALASILRSEAVARVDIIDNSPDDSLRSRIGEAAGGDRRVGYRHVENRGYGAGHNISMRESLEAGTDYHLVMNADVRWEGDVIGRMVELMESNPPVGLSMPRVRYPDGTLQYACRMLPTPFDVFAKRFLPKRFTARRMERYLLARADHSRSFSVPYLLGSFLFFRTDALRECGLFDERFFMYPEDIDISRRIHARRGCLYFAGTEIIHDHAAASRKSTKMLRIHIVNMIRYFNKWGWIFDRQRRKMNARLLAELPLADRPEPGRG